MPGLGTLINCALTLLGGFCGLLFGRALNEKIQKGFSVACGLATLFIGAGGTFSKMLFIEDGQIQMTGTMLLVLSLVLGGLVGELLDIKAKAEQFGEYLKKRSHSEGDDRFIDGFTSASLTICIGAMAVIGPINDALYHDISLLVTKGILDCIIVMALSSALGKGVLFSVIPLFVFQGSMTLLAFLIGPYLSSVMLTNLSLVGNTLIFSVGINLLFGKRIPVANFLPSLLFAVLFGIYGTF